MTENTPDAPGAPDDSDEEKIVINDVEIDVTEVVAAADAVLEFMRDKGSDPNLDLSVHISPEQEAEAKEVHALPLSRWEAYALVATLWRAQEITQRQQQAGKLCTCPRCKMMFAFEHTILRRLTTTIPKPKHLPPNKQSMDEAAVQAAQIKASGGLN